MPRVEVDPTGTVAAHLGIKLGNVKHLRPFELAPPATKPKQRPARYNRAAAIDAKLAPYLVDARNGVPDALIAKRASLSPEVVGAWRRRAGIRSDPGRRPYSTLLAFDLQGMTGARPRGPHITSPVAGQFEPPTYVLREPLDYGSFLRAVQTLRANGFSVSQIAAGVGVLQRDVADALRIADTRGTR